MNEEMRLEGIRRIIQKYNLIPSASTIIVGVSGGADSVALLHVLNTFRGQMGFGLHAATFDHQLRGEESIADVRFVQDICHDWGIPVTVGQNDVKALMWEKRLSLEAAARLARYNFLAEVAYKIGAQRIAVAHHADDQAETVLLHVVRGAGLRGLRGMALQSPLPEHPDLTLVRPFLGLTRAEIEVYLKQHELVARQDSSNQDTSLARNQLRLEILPQLEILNPGIRSVLVQLADIASVEDDYIQGQLEGFISSSHAVNEGQISISRDVFPTLHTALQRRWIVWAAGQLGRARDVDYQHVGEAIRLGVEGKLGAVALFRGGLRLRVDYESLVMETHDAVHIPGYGCLLPPTTEIRLEIPSVNSVGSYQWIVSEAAVGERPKQCLLALPEAGVLSLRTRRTGDQFAPLGLDRHTKKLTDWMINRKIPRHLRDRIPLVCVNDQIVAIMMGEQWFISEQAVVHTSSTRIIEIYCASG